MWDFKFVPFFIVIIIMAIQYFRDMYLFLNVHIFFRSLKTFVKVRNQGLLSLVVTPLALQCGKQAIGQRYTLFNKIFADHNTIGI